MQYARRIDHVERGRPQPGTVQVGLNKLHAIESETARCSRAQQQRCPRQIGAYYHAIAARQVQAHLACPAPNLQDARIARNCFIEQTREVTALGPLAQPSQTIARWVSGE